MTDTQINRYVNMVQVVIGLIVFCLFCLAFYFIGGKVTGSMWPIIKSISQAAVIPIAIYLVNFCYLVPKFLFQNRRLYFILLETAVIIVAIFIPLAFTDMPKGMELEELKMKLNGISIAKLLVGAIIIRVLLYICMIMLAIGMRYIVRWYSERKKMEEERRRNAEAELTWLKNQLNPHFLFNTLNNISSLTQIDPDRAQECIAQFSDLLRYALYDSNVKKVTLNDECRFMENYINLMSLRCNEMTRIETRMDDFDNGLLISPLLFISLIENAFKHGVSSHKKSYVKIDMGVDGNDLVFSCENSIHEQSTTNHSCSGIGLENMTRRLELLYPESYKYEQFIDGEAYVVIVRIKNIRNTYKDQQR